ncbi:hypothetical protein CDAR_269601 [Caerostris darwini]|uniref:Uncharacterized protein n=1 Tax=Caerostris darwini TaxID=1538125 RepID=A0AAV4WPD7_9ARAC|nr:hypothetical protein CDAR_269601 [Caerostris darwini]
MFTSQITLREDTFADEGNVSLGPKPAFNEIVCSPIPMPMKQPHKLCLFNCIERWANTNTKMLFWLRISTLMEIRQQLIEFAWRGKPRRDNDIFITCSCRKRLIKV